MLFRVPMVPYLEGEDRIKSKLIDENFEDIYYGDVIQVFDGKNNEKRIPVMVTYMEGKDALREPYSERILVPKAGVKLQFELDSRNLYAMPFRFVTHEQREEFVMVGNTEDNIYDKVKEWADHEILEKGEKQWKKVEALMKI